MRGAEENLGEESSKRKEEKERQPPAEEAGQEITKWKWLRFVEFVLALGGLSSLLALYLINPVLDDYTRPNENPPEETTTVTTASTITTTPMATSGEPTPSETFNLTSILHYDSDYEFSKSEMTISKWYNLTVERHPRTLSDLANALRSYSRWLQPFPFRLSRAIVLFALESTNLHILLLDILSRCYKEPINKLPMAFMLVICEALSLFAMVLDIDMILESVHALIIANISFAFSLSVCFAGDIVYTSVRGNK